MWSTGSERKKMGEGHAGMANIQSRLNAGRVLLLQKKKMANTLIYNQFFFFFLLLKIKEFEFRKKIRATHFFLNYSTQKAK